MLGKIKEYCSIKSQRRYWGYGNERWTIAALTVITFVFYAIYIYSDIIWTTKNGLTVWYVLFDGKSIGEFYITPYPLEDNGQIAYYDFFIYIIFAIWDFPLFIYERITNISFKENYVTLLYAKSIILPFLALCAIKIKQLTYRLTEDKEKADWSVFAFLFSIILTEVIVIMNGYDIFSLFFTLCGIEGYLEGKNKKFIFFFACAIACKMFALFIFIPLILVGYKKLWQVMWRVFAGLGFIAVPKTYFLLYKLSHIDNMAFKAVSDTTVSISDFVSSSMYLKYLWSSEAPLALATMPLFFALVFILWFLCWFNKKHLSDKMIIYLCLISMSIFILSCETHPYWIILVMPYIAILECCDWNCIPEKTFLEVCLGISHILWKVRRSPQCYSYNIINNMLHIEDGDREFWYTGIWAFVSKFSDMIGIEIDNIWNLVRSIFVVSFILLLIYLFPRNESGADFTKRTKRCFYLKAVCSVLVLFIPLLGVYVRFMV